MRTHDKTEVLVVGAGPVGLFAALSLAERGLGVRIVDKYRRSALHSYALALHPGSLRLLDDLGLADDLVRRGNKIGRIGFYRGPDRAGEVDLTALAGPWPFALVLPQTLLEAALEERLGELGVEVRWQHQALSLQAENGTVRTLVARVDEAALDRGGGGVGVAVRARPVQSSFVIGADGFDSLTRRFLGLRFTGHGDGQTYLLCEFDSPDGLPSESRLVLGEGSTSVLWPIGERRGRWGLQVPDYRAACDDTGSVVELVRSRAPWFEMEPEHVEWTTGITFERHLTERFGAGRVWLSGDAAHLTGPVGVQNMNVAFREVHDLAERLASIREYGTALNSLEEYEGERQREWRFLLGLDGGLCETSETPEWARGLGPRLLSCLPASGEDLETLLAQLGFEPGA